MVNLNVQNQSGRAGLHRSDTLRGIAERVCAGEGVKEEVELSVLFCDDAFIKHLNKTYRGKNQATDVLSFAQETRLPGVRVLGDVVISLETVERDCASSLSEARAEVRLLFCHGMLHLLGYDHATQEEREQMNEKQAQYLNISKQAAWRSPRTRVVSGKAGKTRQK